MPLKPMAPEIRVKSIIIEKVELLPNRAGYKVELLPDPGGYPEGEFHESLYRRCRIYLRINDELVVDAVFDEEDHSAAYDGTNDSLPNHISSILSDDEIDALWSMHRDCIKEPDNCEAYKGTDLIAHAREHFYSPPSHKRERWLSTMMPVRTVADEDDKVYVTLRTYDESTSFFITSAHVQDYFKSAAPWDAPLYGSQRHWLCEEDMKMIFERALEIMNSNEPYVLEWLNVHLLGGQRDE